MAIDRTGKVTTTGLMGGTTKVPKAPDMSNLTPPDTGKPQAIAEKSERRSSSSSSPDGKRRV